ncbi:hypothetical protein [Dielma fastidiosa]|uniref:hypothetical protein n=1 Tax=Dielma fastidiosa TaxID=1034346 RepID=UPI0035676436
MKYAKRLLKTDRFVMLDMAKYFSLMIGVMDIVCLYFIALQRSVNFLEMISVEPMMNILFMIAMLMLVIAAYFYLVVKALKDEQNVESCFWHLIILTAINLLLLNYPAAAASLWAIFRYFNWRSIHLADSWKRRLAKRDKLGLLAGLVMCLLLESILYLSIYNVNC